MANACRLKHIMGFFLFIVDLQSFKYVYHAKFNIIGCICMLVTRCSSFVLVISQNLKGTLYLAVLITVIVLVFINDFQYGWWLLLMSLDSLSQNLKEGS